MKKSDPGTMYITNIPSMQLPPIIAVCHKNAAQKTKAIVETSKVRLGIMKGFNFLATMKETANGEPLNSHKNEHCKKTTNVTNNADESELWYLYGERP